jgi:hypothetical protein
VVWNIFFNQLSTNNFIPLSMGVLKYFYGEGRVGEGWRAQWAKTKKKCKKIIN